MTEYCFVVPFVFSAMLFDPIINISLTSCTHWQKNLIAELDENRNKIKYAPRLRARNLTCLNPHAGATSDTSDVPPTNSWKAKPKVCPGLSGWRSRWDLPKADAVPRFPPQPPQSPAWFSACVWSRPAARVRGWNHAQVQTLVLRRALF